MTGQELATFAVVAAAVGYLVRRRLRRRAAGTCCGERECPAAKKTLDRLRSVGD